MHISRKREQFFLMNHFYGLGSNRFRSLLQIQFGGNRDAENEVLGRLVFGYKRFEFLYLEDTLTADERRQKTLEAINNFFNK